jgi:hypothetical protein
MRSLSGRDFVADLVEEIEDQGDLVHCRRLFCVRGLQYGESLAAGVQVKIIIWPAIGKLVGRPELGLVGVEGVAGSPVSDHHDLAVESAVKKGSFKDQLNRPLSEGLQHRECLARTWPRCRFAGRARFYDRAQLRWERG